MAINPSTARSRDQTDRMAVVDLRAVLVLSDQSADTMTHISVKESSCHNAIHRTIFNVSDIRIVAIIQTNQAADHRMPQRLAASTFYVGIDNVSIEYHTAVLACHTIDFFTACQTFNREISNI